MFSLSVRAAVLSLLLSACAWPQTVEQRIASAAESMRDALIAQRRDFHMHPELSDKEERTSRVIADKLRALGFDEIRTGVSGHGVVAVLKGGKPGPVVAVRADMDALPIEETMDVPYRSLNRGVKHACGHDVHMTVALGTAEVLSRMRAEIPGTVKFLFQPAEEGAPAGKISGARKMIEEGALENPRPAAIFGLHSGPAYPVGTVAYSPAAAMASSNRFRIVVKGKKVHAAWPHLGIDPIVVAAECVSALQTIASRRIDPVEPIVLTIGAIHGGNRNNIIADEVVMDGTLRTHNEAVRERAMSLTREIVTGIAASHGAQAEVTFGADGYPVTMNDTALVEKTLPAMRRAIGAENVRLVPPVMGGEDFAFYQKVIPGFFYWLGVGNEKRGITAMLHTADFDADEACLVTGVKVMAEVVVDFLSRQ